jgi:thiosulfate/3-mercaptopyruvate sulfurtransferase
MPYTTLISTVELYKHLHDPNWVVFDCRFSLADPARGQKDYSCAHIPGAVYAHLDEDLSGPVVRGVTGRHPLPSVEAISEKFSRWGIGPGVQVVAYDHNGGAMAAGRLWWLLRWLGHDAASVLDGGWSVWIREGLPEHSGVESRPTRRFIPKLRPELVVNSTEVEKIYQDPAYRILDARSADRYHGVNEIIDPVAGHIPGAISAPFTQNLTPSAQFMSEERLRERYLALLNGVPAANTVVYCGSGVSAIDDILAMECAGLGFARLYAGSWSEWITDTRRPISK